MNKITNNVKRNKYILFGVGALFLVTIIISTTLVLHRDSTITTVDGVPLNVTGSKNICSSVMADNTGTINQTLFSYINVANEFNDKETNDQYDIVVRNDSCDNKTQTAEGVGINGRNFSFVVNTSKFIVDIADARQSWVVNFEWSDSPNMSNGPGQVQVSCPSDDQLIYGDFNCQKVLDYLVTQETIANCNYSGGAEPGYAGFNLTFNPDWQFDASTLSVLQGRLNSAIGSANLGKTIEQQIICVNAITDGSDFVVDEQTSASRFTFQAQFITTEAELSTHAITFTIDSDGIRTYTLDGQEI